MKNLQDWAAIQKVYKQCKSIRQTAKTLGIARNTVKKLLAMDEPPVYKRNLYYSKMDIYKEQIIEWRCKPFLFNGTRIFRELKKRGYKGSIGPVYRFLRKIDEDIGDHISSKATVRHESPVGDQAQFDWTEWMVPIGNEYKKVYCFSLILSASRKKVVCFSLKVDGDAIYEAIQELYDELGGVTLELLIDNPKALVIENNPKSEDEIEYNSNALMMARHLGIELNACPCYWPRKKGKVERPFNYIEEQFIKGNEFASMEELNRRGKEFVDEWCNEIHTTTKRIPNQFYLLEEKACLSPLPNKHYYPSETISRKISSDSFIHIKSNKYSVPVKYVGKKLFYRINYGFRIMIYDSKDKFILSREISYSKHDTITDPKHYEEIAPKVATSIPQIRRDFTKRFSNGAEYLKHASHKFNQPTHHARKIMELQDLYSDETLDSFIRLAIDNDKLHIKDFKTLLKDYNSGMLGNNTKVDKVISPDEKTVSLTRNCDYYENCIMEKNI